MSVPQCQSPFAGIKRKQQHALGHGLGESEDELDHSKAKRHQSHVLFRKAQEQCLGNSWSPCITDMDLDHSNKNSMDTLFTGNSYSQTRNFPFAFHDAFSRNHQPRPSNPSLNVNISMEHENSATQLTQNSVNPYHNMCTEVTTENHTLNQLHLKMNDPAVSLPAKSQSAQVCSECAAGKSGHIRHIGRWSLMDSQ